MSALDNSRVVPGDKYGLYKTKSVTMVNYTLTDNPKTGDQIMVPLGIMIASGLAMAVIL